MDLAVDRPEGVLRDLLDIGLVSDEPPHHRFDAIVIDAVEVLERPRVLRHESLDQHCLFFLFHFVHLGGSGLLATDEQIMNTP